MSGIVGAAMGAAASSLNPFSRGTVYTSSYEESPYGPHDPTFLLTIPKEAVLYTLHHRFTSELDLTKCSLDQLADLAEQLVAIIEEKQKSA